MITMVGRQDQAFGSKGYYGASSVLYPDHFPWGERDAKPNEMHRIMSENDKALQLMATKVKFLAGSGIGVFDKQVVDGKVQHIPVVDTELEDWIDLVAQDYLKAAAWQWVFSWGVFVEQHLEQVATTGGLAVRASIKVRDLFECRIGRDKSGNAKGFQLCDAFGSCLSTSRDKFFVPDFDATRPVDLPFSMQFVREPIPGQPYYPFAGWWGGSKVMTLANLIPDFHINGIRNGYNLKYLIKIPFDYFIQMGIQDEEEQAQAFKDLQAQLDQWLSGVKNVNKAILTRYFTDPSGKAISGVIIEPLNAKMNDDAYDKIAGYADRSAAASQGILPVLAGIEMGSSSGGSGSQIRLAYDYELIKNAPDRAPLMRPVLAAARINFPKKFTGRNLSFQIIDTQMTTMDEQHGGTKKSTAPQG